MSRFSTVGAVIIAASVALLLYFHHQNDIDGIVSVSEAQNVALARLVDDELRPRIRALLAERPAASGPQGRSGDIDSLRDAILPWLRDTGLLRIDVFDPRGTTLYAAEADRIGRAAPNAADIRRAATEDRPVSRLETTGPDPDGDAAGRYGVSTLVPIALGGPQVRAVVGLTMDITALMASARQSGAEFAALTVLIFFGSYAAMLVAVREAQGSLLAHRRTLFKKITDVRARMRRLNSEADVRERTERALHETEERFRAMTETASEWFWETDADLRFSEVSHRFFDLTGADRDDIIGKTCAEFAGDDEVRQNARQWMFLDSVLQRRHPFRNFEIPAAIGGARQVIQISGGPAFDAQGRFLGYRGTGTRVTTEEEDRQRLRAIETRLANAISCISEGFVLFDANDRLVLCNEKFKEIYPLVADMLVPGVTFEEILRAAADRGQFRGTPEQIERLVADRMERFREPTDAGFIEHLSDGRSILIRERPTENGGVVGIRADITELRDAQEALVRANAELEERVAERTESLAFEITQRELTEAALRDSEYRLRTIVSNAPVVLYSIDPDGRFTLSEGEGLRALGLAPGEVVGQSAYEIYAAYPNIVAAIRACLTGRAARFEVDLDGHFFESMLSPMRDNDGQITAAVGIAFDVTERKQTEEQAHRAEQRLVDAIESISEGFVLHGADGGLVLWNSRYSEIYPEVADVLKPGATIEEIAWANATRGYLPAAIGREEEFVREAVAARRSGDRSIERQLADGRWILINDRITKAGEIVGIRTDITELKRREAALSASEERFRSLVESTSDLIWEIDADWRFVYVSPTITKILGYPSEAVLGRTPFEFMPAGAVEPSRDRFTEIAAHRRLLQNVETPYLRRDGRLAYLEHSGAPILSPEGELTGYRGMSRDVTRRREDQEQLRKLSRAVDQSPASVVITDAKGNIEYVNPKFVELTGYSADEVKGRNPRILKSGMLAPGLYADLWKTVMSGRQWTGELHNRKKSGELFWEQATITAIKDDDGIISHILAVKEDITIRKEYEDRLVLQATHDGLTGLPNRTLAQDRLMQALAQGRRDRHEVGVLYVDLDRFKVINDTLGHAAGDTLLVEAAERLRSCLRRSDTVARIGGDEFLVILPHLHATGYSEVVAGKILETFSAPFKFGDTEFFVTASIGLSISPNDGTTVDEVMRNADAALYRAKESGRNGYRFFTTEMNARANERLRIESLLHKALDRGELALHYQPLVDIHSGRPVGAEALLRWYSPELGDMPPDRFIDLAEDSGLIVPIGEWVLETACRDAAAWPQIEGQRPWVAVNVSFRQFRGNRLDESVDRALTKSGLPPDLLELELNERMMMEDLPETAEMLEKLGRRGIGLAIDDFGTGFSSLGHLSRYSFDMLKIDRRFVSDVTTDPHRATLATAIVALARSLGMRVIGEGIETAAQHDFLRRIGCQWAQGHLFAPPLALAEFRSFLDHWKLPLGTDKKIVDM